jgi:arylsulfatase A-like enzyme
MVFNVARAMNGPHFRGDAMTPLTRRDFMKTAGGAAIGAAAVATAQAAPASVAQAVPAAGADGGKRRPNIVFFLIDDFGWADIACNNPATFYDTPNIDRLAARGVRFTSGYAACPVCSPTRASVMTGKNPARLHLTNFLVGNRWPEDSPITPVEWQHWLPLEETTLGDAFKAAGYATGYVGKWHLGNAPYSPEAQGFDFNRGGCQMGAPRTYFDPYKIPNLPDRKPGEYLTDRLADEACGFIEAQKDGPFLLVFAHYAVHIPLQAKAQDVALYEKKRSTLPEPALSVWGEESGRKLRQVQNHATYAAMIKPVDESVGRIMETLARLGLDEQTIVVFFSDNGGLATAEGWPTANLPLRAGKGWLYEGGIREPMIVRWPGVAKEGTVCDHPVVSDDFLPTLLDMAGLPLRPDAHADGRSFAPLLRGDAGFDRGPLFWHYPHYSNQGGCPGGAVRQGPWKLVEHYEDGRLELFNLADDLGETKDLAAAMPDKAGELRALLAAWRERVGAQMPGRKPA